MDSPGVMGSDAQWHASLLDNLYLSVTEPERLQQALECLVEGTGSRSARLLIMNADATTVKRSLKVNIDDGAHREYTAHYVNTCPWRPELRHKKPGRLYSTYLDFSCKQEAFYQTEFFNDWARRLDIHHGVCGTVDRSADEAVQLLIQRTGGQGPYTDIETRHINSLLPHFRRAFFLGRQLGAERARNAAAARAACGSRLPFLLLDQRGRVQYTSPGAESLIESGQLPTPRQGRFRCFIEADNNRLRRLVRVCLRAAQGRGKSAGGNLVMRRDDGSHLNALVMPIHPSLDIDAVFPVVDTFVAVFLHDPAMPVSLDLVRVASLYGLTDAEVRVAGVIAAGEPLEKLAAESGVSIHTVRAQLKAVFRKTGTSRQSALARLLLTGPGCHTRIGQPTGGKFSECVEGRGSKALVT
ncbi:helix-turn-helix transcriptional regulator [Methylonatrum kenyense]|uniref:helix-turn-helix transcriptional regulator n=1 Tax=Methylonatrum kenyense TaxID=455253 RepID=UPI0020BF9434|nr:helix-turn-helix transcriptional regulator [Methylonatrum kenyense]MCK8516688.1 helix-turn-helix transcriptional regulator [Methylonatrum kenyense]